MPRESFNRVWATDPLPDQFAEPPESRFQTGHVGGAQGELPEASHENWRQNRLDVALQQIERDGAMEWLPDVPYAIGAEARHNGINWVAAIASEGIEPGSAQDEGHWKAPGVASSVRLDEPIDQVPDAETVQQALIALAELSTNFATEAEAQALESLTKLISPARLGDVLNAYVLGMGHTWQDVTASRSAGTTYTNTTGRAISVLISTNNDTISEFYIDNVFINLHDAEIGLSIVSALIPSGSTYRLAAHNTLDGFRWLELR